MPERRELRDKKDNALPSDASGAPGDLGTRVFELAVHKWNLGQYLLGAVGLVAGLVLIMRLTSGNWLVPLIGGPILFVFVGLIRIFAPAPEATPIPHQRVMQGVIGWACVLVLVSAIGIGLWWAMRAVLLKEEPTTSASPDVAPHTHRDNLKGAVHLSGRGIPDVSVKVAEGICRGDPVKVMTLSDGSFSAYCEQANPTDVIIISADYEQNGRHCHAQTDSSESYKLTDKQVLELTCEHEK
ncbi:MAG TPA: hypothetical protein VGG72_31570 [Bryobacteraceae bacterium]|jgi:hypothetical protein